MNTVAPTSSSAVLSAPPERAAIKLSAVGRRFVGSFRDAHAPAPVRLDFEQIDLRADGSYVARVEATLVNPGVRTFGASCMLPESGVWNAYVVVGQTRLRIRPTTGRARVYVTTLLDDGSLSISRRGETTTLTPAALASS